MLKEKYKLKGNEVVSIIPVGDIHIGSNEFNEEFLEYWESVINKIKKNRRIYLMGDLLESASKKVGNSAFNTNMSLDDQKAYLLDILKPLKDDIVTYCQGNHECFDEETEILSDKGWINYKELNKDTTLITYNVNEGIVEQQKPISIYKKYVEKELYHLYGEDIDLLVTKHHRFYIREDDSYNVYTLNGLLNRRMFDIPTSSLNLNQDYKINNIMLKLIGYYLGAKLCGNRRIVFNYTDELYTFLVDNLVNITLNKNKNYIGMEYESFEEIFTINELNMFSRNQIIDVMLNIKDYINDDRPYSYDENILGLLQILALKNNFTISINDNVILIKLDKNEDTIKDIEKEFYKGVIYCATTPNDTLIVRRNNKIAITGNSRLSNDYNYNIVNDVSRELGIKSCNQMIDNFKINDFDFNVMVRHGRGSSSRRDLAMGRLVRVTQNIEADLYLEGHNHRLMFFDEISRTGEGIKRKYYGYTGAFLNYDGYPDMMYLPVEPPAFQTITVNKNKRVKNTPYYCDICCPEIEFLK